MSSRVFPYGRTVTLLRRTLSGTDSYGNDTYASTAVNVPNCVVQPGSSNENVQWTDQVNIGVVVFMPYGTEVSPLDAIVVDGVTYEIDGDPNTWVSPFSGNVSPIQVNAVFVKGASA